MEASGQFYDRAVYLRIMNYWHPMDRAWTGPRGTQDVLKKRKIDCPCQISKSGSSKPEPRGYNIHYDDNENNRGEAIGVGLYARLYKNNLLYYYLT
jgi:hypothetical protein